MRDNLDSDRQPQSLTTPPVAKKSAVTKESAVTKKKKKSSACGPEIEIHLMNHNIYLPHFDHGNDVATPEPKDLHQTQQALVAERASPSLSEFPPSTFQDFKRKITRAEFKNDVMSTLIPVICGTSNIPNKQDVLFTELSPIAGEMMKKPKPGFFDGARLSDFSQEVRDDEVIRSTVIPTKHRSVPIVPNFYMVVKGPDGTSIRALRQACYVGSYGARAMHALQNYGVPEPMYDGNAYTYSSTYIDGALKIFAHHVTAPKILGGRPEYHMTQLRAFLLADTREDFIVGAMAFRNARELAARHRRSFIEAANSRASQPGAVADRAVEEAGAVGDSAVGESDDVENADDTLQ